MPSTSSEKRCKQSKNSTSEKTQHQIKKRMQNNDISKIVNMGRQSISPAVYSLLQHSATTASVKNSLSILRKLLAKNRKFKVENENSRLVVLSACFYISILAPDDCRVGCSYKACVFLSRICVFWLNRCLF